MTSTEPIRDQYRVSRLMYIIEACLENFITILTSGAYLASLTKYLGISDGVTAIISQVINLSALFQIVTIFISHKTPVKRWVVPIHILSHVLFCMLYLLPVFNIKAGAGIILFLIVTASRAMNKIISPARTTWFFTLVDPNKRGSFSSTLTAVSVIGMIPFTLTASFFFDSFVNSGNMHGAFIMLTIVIVVLTVLDAIPLFIAKEKPEKRIAHSSPFSSVKELMCNSKYIVYLLIFGLQAFSTSLTAPFTYTYQISELGFSLSFISIMETAVNVVWIASLLFFGRISKRLPYSFLLKLCAALNFIVYTVLAFTTPSNGTVMYFIYRIIQIISGAASAVSLNNLLFDIIDREHQTNALSLYGIISGLVSFFTTLAITPFFNYLQGHMPTLFGTQLYAQQVLAMITASILIVVNVLWHTIGRSLTVKHDTDV